MFDTQAAVGFLIFSLINQIDMVLDAARQIALTELFRNAINGPINSPVRVFQRGPRFAEAAKIRSATFQECLMNIREMTPAAAKTGRLRQLDLNLLVTLEALLTHQNIARAAEDLATAEPTVSHDLLRLRDFFRDDLLVPKGRDMVLTPLAQQLMAPLRNILVQTDTLLTQNPAFDPKSAAGSLSIVATDYFLTVLGADLLRRVALYAPNLNVAVDTSKNEILQRLERGEVDVTAGLMLDAHPDHPAEELFQDSPVCVAWRDNLLVGDHMRHLV